MPLETTFAYLSTGSSGKGEVAQKGKSGSKRNKMGHALAKTLACVPCTAGRQSASAYRRSAIHIGEWWLIRGMPKELPQNEWACADGRSGGRGYTRARPVITIQRLAFPHRRGGGGGGSWLNTHRGKNTGFAFS